MNSNEAIIERRMWEAVGPDAHEDWAVWEAAHDSKVLAALEIIEKQRSKIRPKTVELAKKELRVHILNEYETLPPDRCEDVFLAAQAVMFDRERIDG